MSKRSLTYVRASSSFSGFSADFTLVGIKEKKKKLSISAKCVHIKYIYVYILCVWRAILPSLHEDTVYSEENLSQRITQANRKINLICYR